MSFLLSQKVAFAQTYSPEKKETANQILRAILPLTTQLQLIQNDLIQEQIQKIEMQNSLTAIANQLAALKNAPMETDAERTSIAITLNNTRESLGDISGKLSAMQEKQTKETLILSEIITKLRQVFNIFTSMQ